MPYEVVRSPQARSDIRHLARYLTQEAGATIAAAYLDALERDLVGVIANNPNAFIWFHETGAPYRAKLFKLARTTYWIVYVVDDERRRVEVVRLWHSAREPQTHGL